MSDERPPFFERGRLAVARPVVWLAILLVAWTSLYYTYFAIVLIGAMACLEGIAGRRLRPLASAGLVIVAIVAALAVALAPSIRHRLHAGAKAAVATRSAGESDVYALRPVQLLLPADTHRSATLSEPARRYSTLAPHINENRTSALGLVGASGFLALLLHLLAGGRVLPPGQPFAALARATGLLTLFGVSGGLGVLAALFVTPQFRALNRLSVVIGFLAIAGVVALLDRLLARLGPLRTRATWIAGTALVAIAFVDQRPKTGPDRSFIVAAYESDRTFVAAVEAALPHGATVYQLPHARFPEEKPFRDEPPYSPLRMYVHSTTLRWSYGDMKGRAADYWHRAVSRLPLGTRVDALVAAGYAGVVVDRLAAPARGRDIEATLRELGAGAVVESADRSLAFYRLPLASDAAGGGPLVAAGGAGFYPPEGEAPNDWSWASGNAEVLVHHFGSESRPAVITGLVGALSPREVIAKASGREALRIRVSTPGVDTPLRLPLRLTPGWNTISFETDGPAGRAPDGRDRRRLSFVLRQLHVAPSDRAGRP